MTEAQRLHPFNLAGAMASFGPEAETAVATEEPHGTRSDEALPIETWGAVQTGCPNPLRHPLRFAAFVARSLYGIAVLVLLLAIVAAVPLLNFVALGYLLEAEGRVARSGRLRDAVPLLDVSPRLGSIVLGIWIWVLPLRLLASYASDAALIDPASPMAVRLGRLTIAAGMLVTVHLCLALLRGGTFASFFRPIKNVRYVIEQWRNGTLWEEADRRLGGVVRRLQVPRLFWLGVRGFLAAAIWLIPPTVLFAATRETTPIAIIATLLGGLGLVVVFGWVPFLQARFAAEDRFRAVFELGTVRRLFRRAPIAWLIAIVLVFVLSLPLYLFKIRLVPQDAMWLTTLVFIGTIYPARVVTGWAYHRAAAKERDAWFGLRWATRLLIFALLAAYVFLLFFTQFVGQHGKQVLFEHHAFLLPVPF